jgi:hypothetical protein
MQIVDIEFHDLVLLLDDLQEHVVFKSDQEVVDDVPHAEELLQKLQLLGDLVSFSLLQLQLLFVVVQ